jgi:hypothetical protein
MARIWFGLDLLWLHGAENRHNSLVNTWLGLNIPDRKIPVTLFSRKVNNYVKESPIQIGISSNGGVGRDVFGPV